MKIINKWLRRYWALSRGATRVMEVRCVRFYVADLPAGILSGQYVWLEPGDLLMPNDYLRDEDGVFQIVGVATNAEMRVLEARRAMRYVGP